jgi:O-methyltransferase involved in polyketide biosynthesis
VARPPSPVFAPVDFERQTLREGLEESGFDFRQLAVVSWVGVTMHLTLGAINATLATLARCRAGTRVVLTYNQPRRRFRLVWGNGPEVTGTAEAILMAVAGRPAALADLSGDGLPVLAGP